MPRLAAADTSARAAVPPDLADRIRRLTLAEIVDLGLRNNPTTRLAWANAQAAASVYGSERGAWLPTIDADVSASRLKTAASQGRTAVEQSVLTPSVTLSYLLFDFGGPERAGRRSAPAVAGGELHSQRVHPGRGAPDPGRLLPVSGQPRPARGPAHHAGGSGDQSDRRRRAAPGRRRHDRRRAPGPDRGEPGAARPPDHRGQPADHPRRAGARARASGQPAVRRGLERGGRAGGAARRQRERDHRHRLAGPAGPRGGAGGGRAAARAT